jgi:hypothetical protein
MAVSDVEMGYQGNCIKIGQGMLVNIMENVTALLELRLRTAMTAGLH